MEIRLRDATYLYALSQLRGVGQKGLLKVAKAFPEPDSLIHASRQEITQKIGEKMSQNLLPSLSREWPSAWRTADEIVQHHIDKGIVPVPITDENYPSLLKFISDPPAILYVKGSLSILCQIDNIAIVGTRVPTTLGMQIANRVAKKFAQTGYTIVSGLAKGIDTAAHLGALDAGGITIAVLGTSLDKVYPAENRLLADRINGESGALVSELALGQKSFRSGFVQRDRIQSGLSLGVIPVQTDVTGGTMHTVKFAEEYGRLIFCPKPFESEMNAKQNAGIHQLIRSGRATVFQSEDYPMLQQQLEKHKAQLSPGRSTQTYQQKRDAFVPVQGKMNVLQTELPFSKALDSNEIIEEIQRLFRSFGLDNDLDKFNQIVRALRNRMFGQ